MTRGSGINVTGALALICILVGACSLTMAQADREFKDEANGFMITLVGNWRAVPYTDAVGRQKTEFVYENRDQGLLRITRDNLRGSTLHDMVRREMDEFAFCNSCVFAGQEAFAGGSLRGIRVALYYIEGGRRIVGTFYFLQERESVWILRFNGRPGSSGMGHEITDAMARSFCSVGALYYSTAARSLTRTAVSTSRQQWSLRGSTGCAPSVSISHRDFRMPYHAPAKEQTFVGRLEVQHRASNKKAGEA